MELTNANLFAALQDLDVSLKIDIGFTGKAEDYTPEYLKSEIMDIIEEGLLADGVTVNQSTVDTLLEMEVDVPADIKIRKGAAPAQEELQIDQDGDIVYTENGTDPGIPPEDGIEDKDIDDSVPDVPILTEAAQNVTAGKKSINAAGITAKPKAIKEKYNRFSAIAEVLGKRKKMSLDELAIEGDKLCITKGIKSNVTQTRDMLKYSLDLLMKMGLMTEENSSYILK